MGLREKDISERDRFTEGQIVQMAACMSNVEAVAWLAAILGNELDYRYVKRADDHYDAHFVKPGADAIAVPDSELPLEYTKGLEKLRKRVGIAKEMYGGNSILINSVAEAEAELEDDFDEED